MLEETDNMEKGRFELGVYLQQTTEQKARWDWKRILSRYGQNRGEKETRKKIWKKIKCTEKKETASRNTAIIKLLSLLYFGIFTRYNLAWDEEEFDINLKILDKICLWIIKELPFFFIYFSINMLYYYYYFLWKKDVLQSPGRRLT